MRPLSPTRRCSTADGGACPGADTPPGCWPARWNAAALLTGAAIAFPVPRSRGRHLSMAPDPTATHDLPAPARAAGVADKVRLRFHKGGSLRWLSHHDLMRTFE